MSSRAVELYTHYITAFAVKPDEERRKILDEVVDAEITYRTPTMEGIGSEIILQDIHGFQSRFAGGRFALYSSSEHHDVALMEWQLIHADGTPGVRGHDAVRLTAEGRFLQIVTFAPGNVERQNS